MTYSVVIACDGTFEEVTRFVEEAPDVFRIERILPTTHGALDEARRKRPDLLLVGMRAPYSRTLEIVRTLKEELSTRVVVLCDRGDAGWAVEALHVGASAYLFADTDQADALRILQLVSAREARVEGEPQRPRTGQPRRSRTGTRAPSTGGAGAARSGPFPGARAHTAIASDEPGAYSFIASGSDPMCPSSSCS